MHGVYGRHICDYDTRCMDSLQPVSGLVDGGEENSANTILFFARFFFHFPLFVFYYAIIKFCFSIVYDSAIVCGTSQKQAASVFGWWFFGIVGQCMWNTFVVRFWWWLWLWSFCIDNLSTAKVTVARTLEI